MKQNFGSDLACFHDVHLTFITAWSYEHLIILRSDKKLVWEEMKELQLIAYGLEGTSHVILCGMEAKDIEKYLRFLAISIFELLWTSDM